MDENSPPYLVEREPGYFEYQLPVSVKAVIRWQDKVPLLLNERDEWELPGGKLEIGENPLTTAEREVEEELGWRVSLDERPLDAWVYHITPTRHVFVITFLGRFSGSRPPSASPEHTAARLFSRYEIARLKMPGSYKAAIELAFLVS